MQQLRDIINATRMLGVFGFILVLAIIVISLSIFDIFLLDKGVVKTHQYSQLHFALESIEFDLLDLELAERNFLLENGDPVWVDKFNAKSKQVDNHIETLRELSESKGELDAIEADSTKIKTDFELLQQQAGNGGLQNPTLVDAIFKEETGIYNQLNTLDFDSGIMLRQEVEKQNHNSQRAIMIGIVGLIVFPLLAIWAFLVASQLTQPLLRITNAVIAISGGHYREELLNEVLDRHDRLGQLAKTIDELADTLKAQEVALETEAQALRNQLHDTRRRKLVLTAPRIQSEE